MDVRAFGDVAATTSNAIPPVSRLPTFQPAVSVNAPGGSVTTTICVLDLQRWRLRALNTCLVTLRAERASGSMNDAPLLYHCVYSDGVCCLLISWRRTLSHACVTVSWDLFDYKSCRLFLCSCRLGCWFLCRGCPPARFFSWHYFSAQRWASSISLSPSSSLKGGHVLPCAIALGIRHRLVC